MISVAMATYNGQDYIERQLDSIFSQTLPIDELIICDDGSSDNTVEVIQNYMTIHSKYPIHFFVNEKNLGYRNNFHKAMTLCSGDYTFLCDQDDLWKENKVEVMIQTMKEHPHIQVLASAFTFMNEQDQPIQESMHTMYTKKVEEHELHQVYFDEYLTHNYFQGCALVLNQKIKNQIVEHFSDKIPHDWLINMTAAKEAGMYFLNESLFYYRIHSNNAVGVPAVNWSKKEQIVKKNTLEIRTLLPKEGLATLEALKETNPDYYQSREEEFEDLKTFYQQHIEYLEQGKFFKLLMQNTNKHYGELKTKKARIMDLIFVLEHKIKK